LRLQNLVQTLSEASRYESGAFQLDEQPFNINAVIREDVYGLESLLNENPSASRVISMSPSPDA